MEIVRKLFAWQGDPRVFELIDPEVTWTNFSSAPEQEPFVGHAGVLQWLAGFVETLGDFEFIVDEIIDAGERGVVSVSHATGRGMKSGVPVEISVSTLYGFRDGRSCPARDTRPGKQPSKPLGCPSSTGGGVVRHANFGSVAEPFQLPFGSREERIAHNEAWSRSLNERKAEWAGGREAMPNFRCECWQAGCTERIALSGEDWTMVRAEPTRFAVAPDHVAESFEAVVTVFPGFWLLEKFGEAGEIAEELDSSN